MVTLNTSIENSSAVVTIKGAATIETAADVHKEFIDALNLPHPVIIDMAAISECDTSFLQLIASLDISLQAGGRPLSFKPGAVAEPVCAAIAATGFRCQSYCSLFTNGEGCDRLSVTMHAASKENV